MKLKLQSHFQSQNFHIFFILLRSQTNNPSDYLLLKHTLYELCIYASETECPLPGTCDPGVTSPGGPTFLFIHLTCHHGFREISEFYPLDSQGRNKNDHVLVYRCFLCKNS